MENNNKKSMYVKNMEILKENNYFLWDIVKDKAEQKNSVYIDYSMHEEEITAIEKEGELWYLNSRYDARSAAHVWAESLGEINYVSTIIVFGFSNGIWLEELRKKYPENLIIVYEPSRDVFDMSIDNLDIANILADDKILIAVGEEGVRLFAEYVHAVINYSNYRYVIWKSVPNYERIFKYDNLKIQKIYMSWVRQITISRNTLLVSQNAFAENDLKNMWTCLSGYSIVSLKEKMQKKVDLKKYPAIIVSAGPSLDKNVEELKKAKNKAYIIVVDTALKTVLRAGVMPDITVTVDPNKELILFNDDRINDLPILVSLMSNAKVLEKHRGKKIFFGGSETYVTNICKSYHKELPALESGGSVANNAFSFARYLGFEKIILVGQDLAYPDNKGHASAAYDDDKKNTIDFAKKKYFEVEDIYGGKVWTEGNMDAYRTWFETQIVRYPELRVIDATEGGARIHGTEILLLKDVIKNECEDLQAVDFESVTNEILPYFQKDELEKVKEQLLNIPQELDVIKEKLYKGKKLYQRLSSMAENRIFKMNRIKQTISEIMAITSWIEEKNEMDLVNMYNYQADYNLKNKVFDIQKDLKKELRIIAANGIEMMESYFDAIECLEKNLNILYESIQNS